MKVGDKIRWVDVPVGAVVLSLSGYRWWYYRAADGTGQTVGIDRGPGSVSFFWAPLDGWHRPGWIGWSPGDAQVEVVALGLTGAETADDIRRLAGC